jgi:hypothetical protein
MPNLNPLDWITGLLGPVRDTVDDLHTSGEEKLAHQRALLDLEAALTTKALDYEARLTEAKSRVVLAESAGESWLQRNWRPLLMLIIAAIVANNYLLAPYLSAMFDAGLELALPDRLWDLMTLGVGGYIAGRSIEKVTAEVAPRLGKGEGA